MDLGNKENKNFQTELGQKVSVEREQTAELAGKSNAILRNLGEALNPLAKNLKYKGSMAMHVYSSEILGQIFFVAQTATMQDVPEETAAAAHNSLRQELMTTYGHKRQTKRSGF